MKVVVFGKHGQVARELAKIVLAPEQQTRLFGGYPSKDWIFSGSEQSNFSDPNAVISFLDQHRPLVVLNLAAYTAVDKAESEKDLATVINATTPGAIARWCYKHDASLVHFSTDYVYPGHGTEPWKESDPAGPISHYGKTKLAGDMQIIESGCHYIILRTSWVYSKSGTNFVRTMLKLGRTLSELKVVSDQIGSPTSAQDLAVAVLHVIDSDCFKKAKFSGVYHVAGQGQTSWYEFALAIFANAAFLNFDLKVKNIQPIPTESYPTPAPRPLNSRIDQSKIEHDFGVKMPRWHESLTKVIRDIVNEESL